MGIELARAFITVGADSSGASSAFKEIEKQAEDSMANVKRIITVGADSSGASSAFKEIEKQAEDSMANVKRIMTSVLGFVGSYIGASKIKEGLFAAGTIEQDQIAFETLLGSAEEANKLIRDLTDFAAKTPFEMPGIKVAARGLVTFGERGQELMDTLNTLGNAAAGTSSDFGMLALIYNQIRGVGKLLTQDFRQLASRGVISLQEVADYYGVTTAAAQEMMSKGQISFEDVKKMLAGFSQEGGKFFNLMERQSGSFLGMMSTVKDTVNITMAAIGEGIRPAATAIMGATLPLLETIRAFTQATGPLVGNIAVMTTAITSLTSSILAARAAMKMMGLTFRQVLIGTGWGIALVALGVAMGAAVTGVQKLWGWLTSLKPVQDAIARMTERLSAAWEIFKNTMVTVGDAIWSALKRVGDVILNYFGINLEGLPGTASEAFISILDTVSNFAVEAASLFGAIVENWGAVWSTIGELTQIVWNGATTYMAENWREVLAAVVDLATISFQAIGAALGAAFMAIDWGKLGDAFGNVMKTWAAHQWGMISGLSEVFNWLLENWADVLTRMLNAWKSYATALPTALYEAIKTLASGGTIGEAFTAAIDAGMTGINSAVGEAYGVGAEAAGAFADGYGTGFEQAKGFLGVDQTLGESFAEIGTQAGNAATAAAAAAMSQATGILDRMRNVLAGMIPTEELAGPIEELRKKIDASRAKLEQEAMASKGAVAAKPGEKTPSEVLAEAKAGTSGTSGFVEFGTKIQDLINKNTGIEAVAENGKKQIGLMAKTNEKLDTLISVNKDTKPAMALT